MKKEIIVDILCFLFAVLFLYTAMTKLWKFHTYLYDLGRSPLLGKFAGPLSVFIPGSELLITVLLFIDRTRLLGLKLFAGMMILFTVYVVYAIYFAKDMPCTCGGIIRELSWRQHLVFNLIVTVLSILAIRLHKTIMHTDDKGRAKVLVN